MSGLLADLRHAARIYSTTPIASAVVVAVLGVAMAVVAAFLSLYSNLVLEAHPGFERGGELITVGQSDGEALGQLSLRLIDAINAEVGSLAALAGTTRTMLQGRPVELNGEETQLRVELVTARYFADIRPRLALGRPFDARDHARDAERVVILSDAYWRERFGGSPDVIGSVLSARNTNSSPQPGAGSAEPVPTYRVVGVLDSSLTGTFFPDTHAWMPFEQVAPTVFAFPDADYARFGVFYGIGRLADGATAASVAAELRGRFAEPDPDFGLLPDRRLDALPALAVQIKAWRGLERQVQLFLAGSLLIALVAACNVSLFLLARAPGRRRELGIRMAVGAPLKRLARQLATEAGLLVVVGTAAGVVLSLWLTVFVQDLAFLRSPFWRNASPLDWRVLGMTAGLMLVLTLLVSLAPVAGLRRLGIASSARSVVARAGAAQRLAGTVQIAVAAVLASAALAFGWYLAQLAAAEHGYAAANVHVVDPQYEPTRISVNSDVRAFITERERRRELIESLPGVEAVAFATSVPGRERLMIRLRTPVPELPAAIENTIVMTVESADHAFTALLGMTLVHGRAPDPSSTNDALVNETLARALWNRIDAAGEALDLFGETYTVVGVVRDVSFMHPDDEVAPKIMAQATISSGMDQILIKGPSTTAQLRRSLQALIDAGELDFGIGSIETAEALVSAQLAGDRDRMLLTVAAAALVVVLAGFGFYGTQRYLVSAGRREFAIRAALGAGPRALGRMVLARALGLALPGFAFGSLLGFVLVAWLRGELVSHHVSPYAITFVVGIGIAALVFAASLGPARQARRTQAGLVLREE